MSMTGESMYKRLKILVPTAQVLACIAIALWNKLNHSEAVYLNYVKPAQSVVTQVDFPLLVLWSPIVHSLDRFTGHFPVLRGAPFMLIVLIVAVVFLSSVALFWYFVVNEIEMRRRGKSLLRFSGWSKQLFMTAILFSFGIGAAFKAYGEARALWYSGRGEGVFNGVFLVAWGIVFIGTGIRDLAVFLNNRPKSSTTGGSN